MIHSKRSVTKWAADFISVLSGDFLILTLITAAYTLFPALHFDITKVSLESRTEHQEAVSFACRSQKKYLQLAVLFVTGSFYLCGVNI